MFIFQILAWTRDKTAGYLNTIDFFEVNSDQELWFHKVQLWHFSGMMDWFIGNHF